MIQGLYPAGSIGQFYVIVEGTLLAEEQPRRKWESLFLPVDEKPRMNEAGDEGLQIVCLQCG